MIYSWGANSYGQLGQGLCNEQCNVPTSIENSANISKDIIQVAGGAGHTLLLDNKGRLYGCGLNSKGQVGVDTDTNSFIQLAALEHLRFIQISCGWDFSAAITDEGKLFVWGSNHFKQLGIQEEISSVPKPYCVENLFVKQVACGLRHMAVINQDNCILICGNGSNGQLGIVDATGNSPKTASFTLVPDIFNVKMVACGQKHTAALTYEGYIYVWGDNKWGQLGLDPQLYKKSTTPIKLDCNFQHLPTSIYTGWTHIAVLNDAGEIWTWGRNNYGQLGNNCSDQQLSFVPKKVEIPFVKQFACGSEHNLALDMNNVLYSWGWNEHGNCGTGSVKNVLLPMPIFINNKLITNNIVLGCGTGQSFFIIK